MTLKDAMQSRSRNIGMVKIAAAILVMLFHAFVISTGTAEREWFVRLTDEQATMGEVAVLIFFFYSGLLISASLSRNRESVRYFKRRFLRLIPPLAAVVTATFLILGPLVSEWPPAAYFSSPESWKYLLNCILLPIRNLPGVFQNNCYGSAVNGSLWSLRLEVPCYIVCWLIFHWKADRKRVMIPVVLAALAVYMVLLQQMPDEWVRYTMAYGGPSCMFLIGMLCWTCSGQIRIRWYWFLLALAVLAVSAWTGWLTLGLLITLPYILIFLAWMPHQLPASAAKIGNWSYGIYLCAFPVQQTVVYCFGGRMEPWLNMLISIPIAFVCGAGIWYLIEKRI